MLAQRLSFGLTLFLFVLLAAVAWTAREFGALAAYFPLSVAVAGTLLAGVELILSRATAANPETAAADEAADGSLKAQLTGGLKQFVYLAAYLAAIVVFGFFSATLAYLVVTLWLGAGFRLPQTVALALATCLFLFWGGDYIGVVFPDGLIDRPVLEWLDL